MNIAGAFWRRYGGSFDPKAKQPFQHYGERKVSVVLRRETFLTLASFAAGKGLYILIRRAAKSRRKTDPHRFDALLTWVNEKDADKILRWVREVSCYHNTPPERFAQILKFRALSPKTQRAIVLRFLSR